MKEEFVIGVLGGMGTQATVHLFQQYAAIFSAEKEWDRPRIIIDNRCTMPSRVRAYLYNENVDQLVEQMSDSMKRLLDSGCSHIILDCNTSHLFLPSVYQRLPELKNKVVNIIEHCVNAIANDDVSTVYVLGTEGTVDSGIYQNALKEKGIVATAPSEDEYHKLRECIEAVKQDIFSEEVFNTFLDLVNRYDHCILGCTELPILYEKCKERVHNTKVYDPLILALQYVHDEYMKYNDRRKSMKALILAAGFGKRLQPITNTIPKSMVEVNGTPLLVNALNNLTELGIKEIGIVVGHMASYIKDHIGDEWKGARIRYFENPRYLETNNVVSLYEAIDFCDDDMLMLECDIYYHKEMLEALMAGEGECSILVSPFNPETMDGSVIRVDGDKALELILGKWQGAGFDYSETRKTVNMYRFTQAFTKKYMPMIKWYVENMGEQSYYEKVLGSLMYLRECDMRIVEVPEEMWCEVDDATDLERARTKFGGGGTGITS